MGKARGEGGSRAYASLLGLKEALGPRLTLLPYDRNVAENGSVRSFLAAIRLPEDGFADIGPERRANESVGPIAVAAARDTLARLRQRGWEPSGRERHALSKALNDLIGREPPETAFQGLDEPLAALIESEVTDERERFSLAVWGKSWTEIFPPKERKPRNVFDPATASAAELDRYQRYLEALATVRETP